MSNLTDQLFPCRKIAVPSGLTRREWLGGMGYGAGAAALASLLGNSSSQASPVLEDGTILPHFAPKAKRVICLFMSGGASQLESFDHKPMLKERHGQPLPASVFKGRVPLGMSQFQNQFPVQSSRYPFQQYGQSGAWISDRFPYLAQQADKLCFLKGMVSDAVNHDPAIIFMNSGHQLAGRPTMGAWLSYGLGSENENLPAYIVMVSKRTPDQPLSSRLWDSGFLPSQHQGVPFRSGKDPVLFLHNPEGLSDSLHQRMVEQLIEVQQEELHLRGEAEIAARIKQFEMAFRMQTAVPEVTDISQETKETLNRYGKPVSKPGSFARNCLIARKLCEKGVRFIQLFHPGWDHHAGMDSRFSKVALDVDQPAAALLQDLEERGLLQETLVMFVTEFGRTPYGQGGASKGNEDYGREHHRDAFTFWVAGGGIKPGITYGETDEFGFDVVDGKVTVNDFHATMLHQLGIDHERFTYRFQGRDYRLTNVAGTVVKPILV
ncbi:DUF1501 domain-containing protein [soil metagenome]